MSADTIITNEVRAAASHAYVTAREGAERAAYFAVIERETGLRFTPMPTVDVVDAAFVYDVDPEALFAAALEDGCTPAVAQAVAESAVEAERARAEQEAQSELAMEAAQERWYEDRMSWVELEREYAEWAMDPQIGCC